MFPGFQGYIDFCVRYVFVISNRAKICAVNPIVRPNTHKKTIDIYVVSRVPKITQFTNI